MIIWQRWGILIIPIVALCVGLMGFIWFELLHLQDAEPYIEHLYILLAYLLASPILWFVGNALNKKSKDKVYINKQTGEEVRISPQNTLFYIRIENWAFILPVIGIIAYIVLSTKG